MRKHLLLVISIAFAATTRAQNPVTIELPGGTLTAKDGFRARIFANAFTQTDPHGREYSACTFDVYVPRRVGKTTLGYPSLEITRSDGRSLAEVAMRNYAGPGEPPHFYVFAERRSVRDCVLRIDYTRRPWNAIDRYYVIHLKYHIPPEHRRPNQAALQRTGSDGSVRP
jgi:hypothetical protein